VMSETPAQKAGLQAGDVIFSVQGHPVRRIADLTRYLEPGSMELEIIRDKQQSKITVEIESRRNQRRGSMRL